MKLIVYSRGIRAGVLDMADSEPFYGFTYDPEYLASRDAGALSLSLPLQEARFDGSQALPFFEGLLPEGDVRTSIARQLGVSESSPARLLKALGKDCAGDVSVLEEDDPYQPPAQDAYAPLDDGLARIARNPFGEISRLRAGNRLSLAGGQEKIALYHDDRENIASGWYVPVKGSPSTHIIKPQINEMYPQLVYNEFLCMKLAKLIGIHVASVSLATYDRPLLIIERFDREKTGQANADGLAIYTRTKQEDFCQALGFDSSHKYELDGGPGIADLCKLLLSYSARFIEDRQSLMRLVLFNYLIGNCDAHGKNYSAQLGASGAIRLAPAYDLLSTTVYDGSFGAELARGMGMRIGRHANIDRVAPEDFTLLANECGLSKKRLFAMARELVEQVANRFDEAKQELAQATADDIGELTSRIWTGIEARSRTLLR